MKLKRYTWSKWSKNDSKTGVHWGFIQAESLADAKDKSAVAADFDISGCSIETILEGEGVHLYQPKNGSIFQIVEN